MFESSEIKFKIKSVPNASRLLDSFKRLSSVLANDRSIDRLLERHLVHFTLREIITHSANALKIHAIMATYDGWYMFSNVGWFGPFARNWWDLIQHISAMYDANETKEHQENAFVGNESTIGMERSTYQCPIDAIVLFPWFDTLIWRTD